MQGMHPLGFRVELLAAEAQHAQHGDELQVTTSAVSSLRTPSQACSPRALLGPLPQEKVALNTT